MERKDVQHIIDAKIGSYVSMGGKMARIVGMFGDLYITENDISYAHTLALEGEKELGAEYGESEWHTWHSRFSRTYPRSSLDDIARGLKSIETGRIERVYSEGCVETDTPYPNYVFGRRMGKGVFIGIGKDDIDVWVNVTPTDVKVL